MLTRLRSANRKPGDPYVCGWLKVGVVYLPLKVIKPQICANGAAASTCGSGRGHKCHLVRPVSSQPSCPPASVQAAGKNGADEQKKNGTDNKNDPAVDEVLENVFVSGKATETLKKVSLSMLVADFKLLLENESHVASPLYYLTCLGKVMEDRHTLSDYGLVNGCTVQVRKRATGGRPLDLQSPTCAPQTMAVMQPFALPVRF